jgi:hypothetical protein
MNTISTTDIEWPQSQKKKRNEKKNYAGSNTLPATNKEKETHWP